MGSQRQKAICILGMHRSGTSAVARAIDLLGAYIGRPDQLLPPKDDNPEGFWEHLAIVEFHEKLLQTLSRSWDTVLPLPEEWWKRPEVEPFHKELKELVQREFTAHPLWMWKDPRTCLLLPLWIEVLGELEVDLYFVISLRNPLDVAASLKKRDGFTKAKSFALWYLYNLSSFYWTSRFKRIILSYDKFLEEWEQCLKNLAETFGIAWPQDDNEIKSSLENFLKPNLRHSYSSLEKLALDNDVPEPVAYAYRLFLEAEKSPDFLASEGFVKKILRLFKDYNSYAKMINPFNAKEISSAGKTIQIYWPLEGIYSEENSVYTDVIADGEFHSYELQLPAGIGFPLRLDPVNFPAHVEIKSIELFDQNNKVCYSLSHNFDDSLQHHNVIKLSDTGIFSFLSVNEDPQIFLKDIVSIEKFEQTAKYIIRILMRVDINYSHYVKIWEKEKKSWEEKFELQYAQLAERNKQIALQEANIITLKANLFEKEEQIKEKEKQVSDLSLQLIEKEELISNSNKKLAEFQSLIIENEQKISQLLGGLEALKDELANKENQLNQILSSFSWKVTTPLRLIRKAGKKTVNFLVGSIEVLLRRNYKPRLVPIFDIEKFCDNEAEKWQSTGNDPQFFVDKPYPKGWAKVKIKICSEDGIRSRARLYINRGNGYNEADSYDLGEIGGQNILQKHYVQLGPEVIELRLDPFEMPAFFRIEEFTLTRISYFEVLFVKVINHLFRRISRLVHFVKYTLSLARSWKINHGRLPSPGELPFLVRKAWYKWQSYHQSDQGELKPPPGFELPQAMDPYDAWLEVNQWNNRRERLLRQRLSQVTNPPLISVIMPVYNPPIKFLERAINSVREQVYENWELCIADDASADNEIRNVLRAWSEKDKRIVVCYRDVNGNISKATNSAAALAKGDYLLFLDHDDELTPDALAEVALYICQHPETDILYSDDDKIDADGRRFAPQFKPDWSPELLLSYMYFSHLFAIRRSLFEELGGMREGFEGSQDYDLALRATEHVRHVGHIPKVLYHWRVLPGSTASSGAAKPSSIEAGRRAVEEAIKRRGINAKVIQPDWAIQAKCGIYELVFPDDGPSVTILIPTRNNVKVLKRCLESLRLTTYKNYEVVIIDNESDDPKTLEYLKQVPFRVIRIPNEGGCFNFAAINNKAAAQMQTDYVLFLNDDTEVRSPRWLSQLVGYLGIPGVGAVGARLLYPDGRVQHAGIIHGLYHGMAGPSFKLMLGWDNGYLSYAAVTRNYLAVTAACLLTRRDLFLEFGGFNEQDFAVAYNDVDFCYRLHEAGYRIVYCSSAELIHYEGYSRGYIDNPKEAAVFRKKYGKRKDPYYNPNLSLAHERFEIGTRTLICDNIAPIPTLMCSFTLNWEGAPYSQYEMTVRLKEKGIINPIIYCHQDGPLRKAYEEKGIPVHIFEHPLAGVTSEVSYDQAIQKFANQIKGWGVELIYGNTLQTFYAIEAAHQLGFPCVWNPRESEPWQTYFNNFGPVIAARALKCFCYPYQVIFVADATRVGCLPLAVHHNFLTIHNGLDRRRIAEAAQSWPREKARRFLGIVDDQVMVLVLGTVCERKGQIDLLEAISNLPNVLLSKTRCFIVGDRPGNYSERLAAIHRTKPDDVCSRIKIIPETPDTALYYSAADIFVCTSRVESFPRVILEAMAYNLPIITTSVFGIVEQVKEGVNAIFYHPGDVNSLAKALAMLISDPGLRFQMATNSSYVLETLNDFDDMTDAYGQIFREAWLSGGSRKCAELLV